MQPAPNVCLGLRLDPKEAAAAAAAAAEAEAKAKADAAEKARLLAALEEQLERREERYVQARPSTFNFTPLGIARYVLRDFRWP